MANTKVTGDVIANGTISTVHLADDAITAAKLDSTATGITFADLTVDTNTLYVDAVNNRVGIGTTSPDARFSVVTATANSTASRIGGLEYSGNQRGLTIKTFQSAGGDDCGVEFNAAEGLSGYGSFIFKADTAERMRIDSSGNVGIGETNPTKKIDLYQSNASFGAADFRHVNGNRILVNPSYNYYDAYNHIFRGLNGTDTRLTIDNSGGVSITPTTSTSFFYGADGTNSYINFETNNIDATVQLYAGYSSGGYFSIGTKDSGGTLSERMRITSGGNIGISGDTSAWALGKTIQINGNYGTINYNGVSAILGIINAYYNGSAYIRQNVGYAGSIDFNTAISGGGFAFRTENTTGAAGDTVTLSTKMAITSAGNVGIGIDSPSSRLHVNSGGTNIVAQFESTDGTGGIMLKDSTGNVELTTSATNGFNVQPAGGTAAFVVTGSGNVGIGTTSPSATFQVNGNTNFGNAVQPANTSNYINNFNNDLALLIKKISTGVGDYLSIQDSTGSSKFIVKSSGNVGIGTSTPDRDLDIQNSTNNAVVSIVSSPSAIAGLVLGDTDDDDIGGVLYNNITNYLYFQTNGAEKMRITSDSNPTLRLGVSGTGTSILEMKSAGGGSSVIDVEQFLQIKIGGSERMRIESNGNLLLKGTGVTSLLKFDSSAYGQILSTSNVLYYDIDTQIFRNSAGTTERMRITSAGNIGIGVISPNAKLHVSGTFFAASGFSPSYTPDGLYNSNARPSKIITPSGQEILFGYFDNGAGGYFPRIGFKQDYDAVGSPFTTTAKTSLGLEIDGRMSFKVGASNSIEALSIMPNGQTIIDGNNSGTILSLTNRNSAPYGLSITFPSGTNTTNQYFIGCGDGVAGRFYVYANGNVVNSNNSYGSISDSRLKENITDATPKLNQLMQIPVKNFNLIGDNKKQIGVIAQDVEKIFPGIVDENKLPNSEDETLYKSVKYSVLVPMLLKGIQEQQEIINELKAEIETLKTQINN